MDLEIASGTADSLVSETAGGNLDFYVGQFAGSRLGISATHVGRYPVALISGVRRGLTSMRPVSLDKLEPLKLFVPSATNSLRPKIEEAIRTGEVVMERKITMDSLSAGFEFVSQTDWSAILPYWIGLQELSNPRVTVNPIVHPTLHVDVALIVPAQRPLSRPAQLLYDYFRRELQRTDEEWARIMSSSLSQN